MITVQQAEAAVQRIVDDISDRAGIKHEWEQIDDATKEEIRDEWVTIIIEESDPGTAS